MKNPELYQKTVDILVQAYFNDTLEHLNCSACAVGNIVAANNGVTLHSTKGLGAFDHIMVIDSTTLGLTEVSITSWFYQNYTDAERKTGYTLKELLRIEKAFEEAPMEDDWMFNGLMAVIDVLDEIHENKDEVKTKATKQRFVKTH